MAGGRRNSDVRLGGFVRRPRAALLTGTALQACFAMVLALPAAAQPAPNARPVGGVVVAGSAAISRSTSNTAISQSTDRAAVNWQSFDVGSQQSVTFTQPSASSVTLNRVTGPDPSRIAGHIDANGQVVLVNQSGVTFYRGAQVNTTGLMVSAAGISNQNFMAGAMTFDQPAKPDAKVVNQGTITVRQAGLAALVAPQVANSGVITAKLGHVVLAGAKTATLDLYGDGLLSLDVTNQVTKAPAGGTALVTNTGVIAADGGTVQLTARAADGIVQTLVQAGGKIRAASMGEQTGTVALNGVGGSIVVEGQLSAPGVAPGTKGGAVEIATNGNVVVAATARINASGKAGGGVVAIGTTLARARGGPTVAPTLTAKNVSVRKGATIAADAVSSGEGGRITVLATDTTHMDGRITATGGKLSGDGGFVEVSGKHLGITGSIDVAAPAGAVGTILLDPDFLNIVAGAAGSGSQDPTFIVNGGTIFATDPSIGADTVANGVIDAFAGNVLLQANNTLTVAAPINLTTAPGQTLVLEAGGTLTVNAGVGVTASGDVILATGGAGPPGPPAAQPSPLIALLGTVGSTGGSVSLLAGAGGTLSIGAAGAVAVASGNRATLQMDTLTVALGGHVSAPSGTIEIAPASPIAMHLGGVGGLAISQAALGAMSANTLRLGGATIGGTLTQTASAISIDGPINLSGIATTLDLQSTGAVTQTAALLNIGTLTGNTGAVTLTSGLNSGIAAIGSYTVAGGGDFALTQNGSGDIGGPLNANNVTISEVGTSAMNVAGTVAATGTVALNAGSIVVATAGNLQGTTIALTGAAGITLSGNAALGNAGAVVDLNTDAGNVVEANTATITAATLRSSFGVFGDASLPGANVITNLGNFAASGKLLLSDASALNVPGTVSASGNVYLQTSNASGITVAGKIAAGAGSLASFQADALAISAGGTITGAGFEYAPNSTGSNLKLGAGGALASLAGIGTGSATIGAVTAPGVGQTITAGTITVIGTFDAGHLPLALITTGAVNASAAPLINVTTLSGSAQAVNLTDTSNTITNLGNFTATSAFTLTDGTGITVGGTVSAPALGLSATSITIPGKLTDGGAGTVNLVATGGTIGETGTLIAGILSGSATGSASLPGATPTSNQVAAIGTFNGASFALDDGTPLTVSGVLNGGTNAAVLANGALTIASGGAVTAAAIGLTADSLTVTGLVTDGGAGTVHLIADTGTIFVPGTLIAGTLSGSAVGGATLTGSANTIATLGSFTASGLSLDDSVALAITGTVNGGAGVSVQDTGGALNISGSVAGNALSLNAASNIVIPGTISDGGSGTTVLNAIGGAITETGTLIAGTLSGGATGAVSLTGAAPTINQVASIGSFTSSHFTLNDGIPLTVAGTLAGGPSATLLDKGNLIVASGGMVTAVAIGLTADNILIAGLVNDGVAGTVSLVANAGTINEIGTLVAGTLSGSAIGAATFAGATNTIVTLGNFVASNFTLNDGVSLALTGTVNGGSGVTLQDTGGSLTIAGLVTGSALSLTAAGNIMIPGVVSDGGSGTTVLNAPGGAVTETGTLISGTLSGSVAGTVSLTGAISHVATIGNFTASGFTLDDGVPLTVVGTLAGGPSVTLLDKGDLTIAAGGAVTAAAIGLTGDNITIAGLVSDGGSGTVNLIANTGAIFASGTLIAGTLSGSAVGGSTLTGSVNTIGTLGNFAASGITLTDSVNLAITGTVNGGSAVTIQDTGGALTITGLVNGNALSLSAVGDIMIPGTISDGGSGTTVLNALGGMITETGTLIAGTLSGSATGSVGLPGTTPTTNQIATIGNFAAAGFTLDDGAALSVNGNLAGGAGVTLLDKGTLTIAAGGAVTAAAIGLTADSITIAGLLSDGGTGTVNLIANVGTIFAPGTLIAGKLSGSAIGPATLTGSANAIGTLGDFAASGIALDDSISLAIAGTANGAANVAIHDTGGALTIAGSVAGDALSLSAASSIVIPGTTSDGGAGTTILSALGGSITETGTMIAGTLSGGATGAVSLVGATPTTNQIATIGNFNAANFALDDSTALIVAGVLNGGANAAVMDKGTLTVAVGGAVEAASIGLTADNVTISGLVTDGGSGTVRLVANIGTINGTGTLIAGTLNGSAVGGATLTGSANAIGALGKFSASGITLDDNVGLAVTGAVTGGSDVAITDTGGGLTIAASVAGKTLSLIAAGNIMIPGTVNAGGNGTTTLTASGGAITETGTLISGALSGGAFGAVSLTGAAPTTNQVAALSSFAAAGFTLDDRTSLTVTGKLAGGPSATLLDKGTLTIAATGTVAATAVSLTSDNITIRGLVTDGGSGTVSLIANTGTINQTGTLIAGTLSGGAVGAANLLGATPTTNQIATLGNFPVTAGSLTLVDTGSTSGLLVTGSVSGSSVAITDGNVGAVTVTGSVTTPGTLLLASGSGGIALNGSAAIGGATAAVDLSTTGGGINEAAGASITAATLQSSGAVAGGVTLPGNNAIASVGNFAVTPGDVRLNNTVSLAIAGLLTADNITLTAPEIRVTGGVTAAATLDLSALTNGITEVASARIIADTLQSSSNSVGAVTLAGTANTIGNLGSFLVSGGDFTLVNGGSLNVIGGVFAGPVGRNIGITALGAGQINVRSGVFAAGGTIALTSGSGGVVVGSGGSLFGAALIDIDGNSGGIRIVGNIGSSGSGVVDLSTTGGITETATGTLHAGVLQSSHGVTGNVLIPNGDVANLVRFVVTGGDFTLADTNALTVFGPVSANNVTLSTTNAGGIAFAGSVAANTGTLAIIGGPGGIALDDGSMLTGSTITLNSGTGGITLTGAAVLGNSGALIDLTTTGDVTEAAASSIVAATLQSTAGVTGAVNLVGNNQINTLGNFVASGFNLLDGSGLLVSGTVNGGAAATITVGGSLSVAGLVTATAVSLGATGIDIPGTVSDGGAGTVMLTTTGTITETGTLIAGSLSDTSGVTEVTVDLTGATPITNQIATLAMFNPSSRFVLNDGRSLAMTGGVTSDAITIVDAGALAVPGNVSGATVNLTANSITIPGQLGGTNANLVALAGDITASGRLTSNTISGSATGNVDLTGSGPPTDNLISVLGDFTAARFTLNDGLPLMVNGNVSASTISLTAASISIPGNVTGPTSVSLVATTGNITETGSVITPLLTGSATGLASLTGSIPTANFIATLGDFNSSGFLLNDDQALLVSGMVNGGSSAAIASAAGLTIAGGITATAVSLNGTDITIPGAVSGVGTVNLIANTGIIDQTGMLIAGTLSGAAAGNASFIGPITQIAALGNFTATGLTLNDNTDLTIAGAVNAGPNAVIDVNGMLTVAGSLTANAIFLNATNGIAIPGAVVDAGSVTLLSGAAITETGQLIADVLTGSSVGDTSFIGTDNHVPLLASFTAGSFTLYDATNLTIGSTLAAPKIVINTGASQIVFANAASIVTGGNARPPGTDITLPTATNSPNGGAFLSAGGFAQHGNSFVAGTTGGANILRIDVTGSGNISFDKLGGLQAPNTWLILSIAGGTATGSEFVQALDVLRSGGSGSAALTGSIGGVTGEAAAGAAGILPGPSAAFRFNSCPIASVSCVVIPSEGVPTGNPLNDIDISTLSNSDEQGDLLLPIVSDQDY